jgi:hypothetical protein
VKAVIQQLVEHLCGQKEFDEDRAFDNLESVIDYDWQKRLVNLVSQLADDTQPLCVLKDKHEDFNGEIAVKIDATPDFVELFFDGYGHCSMEPGYGSIVGVELYQGKLRTVINPNINDEEPQIVVLEGAREDRRIDA